jgi:glycosyltransferase involved in cell wall biosynthesis
VVDASKWPAQALALAQGGVDVRVIHLLRDPRGVAYSLAKSDISRPHALDAPDLMMHSSPAETAVRWSLTQSEVSLLRRCDVPVTRLRYEHFVSAPAESIRAALLDLAIPVGDADLQHIGRQTLELGTSHGLSGNPSRFRAGTITLRADDQWKSRMSASQRRIVTALTLPARVVTDRDQVRSAPTRVPPVSTTRSLPPHGQWPPVSVLVATRGRPELVREAITSIVEQTYPGDIECLVIHDQEPPDPSLEALGRPGCQVSVLASRSTGLAGARNSGLDAASAQFIATCDDDDSWHPRKLELQIERLLAEPDLLLVGSGIRLRLPNGKVSEWPGRADRIDRSLLLRNRVKELHSSTLVMRRDAFAKAGRYDEQLPNGYAEDYDWVLRASRVGRIGIVRTPLADIRKDVQSYYTGQSENTIVALRHFVAKHPEIAASRRGHARMLGQLAFHLSAVGRRDEAVRTLGKALWRWPLSPYIYVALVQLVTGVHPQQIRRAVRLLGRGMA